MHVPNPLGGYPLTLRDKSSTNTRVGELLYDYTNDKIYYKNKDSGEVTDIAKSIYDKLIEAKLENTKLKIVKADNTVETSEEIPVIPTPLNRSFNTFYFNIYKEEAQPEV